MLTLRTYEEVKHMMQLGYNYAARLHEDGRFNKWVHWAPSLAARVCARALSSDLVQPLHATGGRGRGHKPV